MTKLTELQAISKLDNVSSIEQIFTLIKQVSGNVFNPDGSESQRIRLLYSGDIGGDIDSIELVDSLTTIQPEM
jgi:hypothetical protein